MATDTAIAEPSQGLTAYRRVLAAPHVRPLVAFALLARMPIGMGGVALILFVHAQTGSFGEAGIVAGAYTVGLGITGPGPARLALRHRPRRADHDGGADRARAARRGRGGHRPAGRRRLPRRRRLDPDR